MLKNMLINILVRKNKIFYFKFSFSYSWNNDHLYEEVPRKETKKLADENHAIFELISSERNYGINDLFEFIGKKFLKQDLIMAPKF